MSAVNYLTRFFNAQTLSHWSNKDEWAGFQRFQLLAHSVFWISQGTYLYLHYIFTTKVLHWYQCYNYDDLYYPQRVVYNALCWGPSADLDKFPGSPLPLNYVSFCNGEFSFVNCEHRSCLHVHRSHKYLCFIWLFSEAIDRYSTASQRYQLSKVIFQNFFLLFLLWPLIHFKMIW